MVVSQRWNYLTCKLSPSNSEVTFRSSWRAFRRTPDQIHEGAFQAVGQCLEIGESDVDCLPLDVADVAWTQSAAACQLVLSVDLAPRAASSGWSPVARGFPDWPSDSCYPLAYSRSIGDAGRKEPQPYSCVHLKSQSMVEGLCPLTHNTSSTWPTTLATSSAPIPTTTPPS